MDNREILQLELLQYNLQIAALSQVIVDLEERKKATAEKLKSLPEEN